MVSQEMLDLSSWACRRGPDRKGFDYLGQCAEQPVKSPRPQTSFLNGREKKERERQREKEKTNFQATFWTRYTRCTFSSRYPWKRYNYKPYFEDGKKKMWFRKVICSSHPGGSTEIQVVIDPGFKLRIVSSFYVVAADLVKITRVPEIKWTSGRECWTLIRIMLYNSEKLRFPSDISRKKNFFLLLKGILPQFSLRHRAFA